MRRLLLSLLGAVAVGGCLPDAQPVDGRLLFAGSRIERPRFLQIDKEPWVMFELKRAEASGGLARRLDTHLVRFKDAEHRVLIRNRSASWEPTLDGRKIFFVMTDERVPPESNAPVVWTLVRVDVNASAKAEEEDDQQGIVEAPIPDVIGYSFDGDRQNFLYRRYVPGQQFPELRLRNLDGKDRALGWLSGGSYFYGGHFPIYFVAGEDRTLTRVDSFDAEPKALRSRVSRHDIAHAQSALLITSDNNKVQLVHFNPTTLEERVLPIENPCCWLGFDGETFTFAESARADRPAQIHHYRVTDDKDDILKLPEGLADFTGSMARPPEYRDRLIFDSQGRVALWKDGPTPDIRVTELRRPAAPNFSRDGRYLLYIERDPPTPNLPKANQSGKLMVQDAEFKEPPFVLSPHGSSVPVEPNPGFFFFPPGRPVTVGFWAHYGVNSSDLYFANHEERQVLKVAQGISDVALRGNVVLGIVRISLQDLTGDLVQKNLDAGTEELISHGVTDMALDDARAALDETGMPLRDPEGKTLYQTNVAFVVRDRLIESKRNGLWARTVR